MPAQMQYLMTGFVDSYDTVSPQLKRNSKVLSFFNDSEDIVESIGDIVHTDDNIEGKYTQFFWQSFAWYSQ